MQAGYSRRSRPGLALQASGCERRSQRRQNATVASNSAAMSRRPAPGPAAVAVVGSPGVVQDEDRDVERRGEVAQELDDGAGLVAVVP